MKLNAKTYLNSQSITHKTNLFYLAIDLSEGHYKFLFANGKELHQWYISINRNTDWGRIKRDEERKKNITAEAWTLGSTKHMYVNSTEAEVTNTTTWLLNENDMDQEFLNCFSYHENYHLHYENESLRIETTCTVNNDWLNDNKFHHSKYKCFVNRTSSYQIQVTTDDDHPSELEIKVNLACNVIYAYKFRRNFLFIQPLHLRFNSVYNPPLSTEAPINGASSSTAITVVVVMVFLGLTTAVVFHHKRHTAKSPMKILSTSSRPNMEWANNPNYSQSSSLEEPLDDPLLPGWLSENNEMIFDITCITKGRKLGHGNFGAVFEGKIQLGNAV